MATEKQWKQGSVEGEQEAVLQNAITDASDYPIVRDVARLLFKRGKGLSGGRFDQAMKFAGLGLSTTEKRERAQKREGQKFSGR